jgi:hypothetical protein
MSGVYKGIISQSPTRRHKQRRQAISGKERKWKVEYSEAGVLWSRPTSQKNILLLLLLLLT